MNPTGPSLRFGARQPRALLAVRLFSPGVFPSRPDMGSRLEEMPVAAAAFSLPQPLTHRRSLVTGGRRNPGQRLCRGATRTTHLSPSLTPQRVTDLGDPISTASALCWASVSLFYKSRAFFLNWMELIALKLRLRNIACY